jgi:hypothetical protein
MIQVQDEDFVARSGAAEHRNLQFTGIESDQVQGTLLRLIHNKLAQADAYEPERYERVKVRLRSGSRAWVYLQK